MNRPLALCLVLSAGALAGIDGSASADPTQNRAQARALFDQGRQLVHDGHFPEACPKFEESQRLEPGMGTLFNLADCYEHVGRTASAWSNFLEVADEAKRAGMAERETVARSRAEHLASRISHVSMTSADPATAVELKIDGTTLGAGVLGSNLPIDPGSHVVEVGAPGKKSWHTVITVADGTLVALTIPPLEAEAAPAPSASVPPTAPSATASAVLSPPPPPVRPSWQRPAGVVAGGLGVVGAAVGIALGLEAKSDWNSAEPSCHSGTCTPSAYASWTSAQHDATGANVAFVASAVLLAGGVTLWVTAPSASGPQLGVGPRGAVLSGRF